MNLFYCNGAVSVITASALIKKEFEGQRNVLVLEKDRTRVIPDAFTGNTDDYYKIVEMIGRSSTWDEISSTCVKNTFISIESLGWPLSLFPVKNIRILFDKRKSLEGIIQVVQKITKRDRLIVSDNSLLWRYFYKNQCDLLYIEHGAASYRSGDVKKNWKYVLKELYSKLIGVNLNVAADAIYLSDNGRSSRVRYYNQYKSGCRPISFNLEPQIRDIFEKFIAQYKEKYFDAYKELLEIQDKYKNERLYIYIPTSIVPCVEYSAYLKDQIKNMDGIFLIKCHGNDGKRDYRTHFTDLELKSFSFNVDLNNFIPVEILLFFFSSATLIGSYSSSHLYAYWWLNKKTLFKEIEGGAAHSELSTEYRSVYDDMEELK